MEPFKTIALGIIANFGYNFIKEHRIADKAFDGLKTLLFGDAKTVSEIRDCQLARLYSHTNLVSKVKVYQKATNRIHSLLDLVETFDKAISQNEPSLKGKIDEALNYLRTDAKAYDEIIHRLQLGMLWELLRKAHSPEELKKREADVINDYGEKLKKRCQKLDLFGVRGASDVGVQLENIFVTLSFFGSVPPGGLPRIHRDDFPDDERVIEYLSPYKSQEPIEADELFVDPPKNALLILGMPGAGKTTLLKYQSLQYLKSFSNPSDADRQIYLPIFIRLRNFVEYEGYLISRISDYLKDETGEPFDSELLELYLKAGNVAIFYDGLDEIADTAQRNKMAEDIATFVGDYPKGLHVITCRIAAYPEITVGMSSFAKFTLDDMDESRRSEFIHKCARASLWEGEDLDKLADRLIKKIEGTPSIRQLAVNPLMLTIMSIIYADLRNLPDTRLELYEECVNVLMHRRDEARGHPAVQEIRRMMPQPHFILGELAYGLHKDSEVQGSGIAEPPREEIQSRLAKIIMERRKVADDDKRDAIRTREVPDFCKFIEERTSILVDRGMGRYGFAHQTFQEYFAAYYLNTIWDVEKLWSEIKEKIWSPYWREALLLLSEMLARRGDVLDVLLEKTMEEARRKEESSLLLFTDIVFRGIPVTDFFKSRVLERLYEQCLANGELSGDYVDRLEKLGDYGLNEETYTLLEKNIGGTSNKRRLWAIRYFSVRNDLIETYIKQFEKTVEPYVEDSRVRECLLPLLGDLKCLAAPILRSVDVESMITPWCLPPALPFYHGYLTEGERFAEPSYVLRKLSAGMFVYSSNLAFLTLGLGLALDRDSARALARTLASDLDRALGLALDRNLSLALARDLALVRSLALNRAQSLALALALNLDLVQAQALARTLVLDRILTRACAQARDPNQDLALDYSRARAQDLALDQAQIRVIAAIDGDRLFHGAMIHTATLLELVSDGKEELPPHLAYALEKQPDPPSPYVRAAQLFCRFIRREITPEEELEFQQLLNIEDEEVRHIFDLAYLTDAETREPIFRFRSKLELN